MVIVTIAVTATTIAEQSLWILVLLKLTQLIPLALDLPLHNLSPYNLPLYNLHPYNLLVPL